MEEAKTLVFIEDWLRLNILFNSVAATITQKNNRNLYCLRNITYSSMGIVYIALKTSFINKTDTKLLDWVRNAFDA